MCAGCPLHASLILNTGSKLGQKEVLYFRTMEKTYPSSVVYGGKPDRIVLIYVPPLKSTIHCNNKTLSCRSYCSQFI